MDNFDFYDLLEQDQHDPEVQYGLGICYLYGNGTEKDPDEARAWLQRAADQGHELALMLINGSDDASQEQLNDYTLPEWCMRAEEGDADAQFAVAQYFVAGGQNGALSDAQRYLRAAAEQGHGEACLILGKQYMEECNYSSAVIYLERACECSFSEAAELLSYCYFHGTGVPQDPEKAEQLLHRASEWGDAETKLRIALRYALGQDILGSQIKAMAYVARAQQAGMADARTQFEAQIDNHHRKVALESERKRQIEAEERQKKELEEEERRQLEHQQEEQRRYWEEENQRLLRAASQAQVQRQEKVQNATKALDKGREVLALAQLKNHLLRVSPACAGAICAIAIFLFSIFFDYVTFWMAALIAGCYAAVVVFSILLIRKKIRHLEIEELEQLVEETTQAVHSYEKR